MTVSRIPTALAIAAVALVPACGRPRVAPRDPAASSLTVRVTLQGGEDLNLRTFSVRNLRPARRPVLPSAWLPPLARGGGMAAMASEPGLRLGSSWIVVLDESTGATRSISVFPVSPRQKEEPSATNIDPRRPSPPCLAWSAFFIEGIGALPRRPVALHRWENDGPSRTISVDPGQHTLRIRPVLRFSTRDVPELRNRKATFLFGVTVSAGARPPFVLIGLVRRPDGTYSEALFVPREGEQGWGAFVHTPRETTEISFYALDDPAEFHTPCRARAAAQGG